MSVPLPSVRQSVRMEKPGSHWTDFDEISYLRILRRSVDKIQVSLKSDKNNGYFTLRPMYIYDSILLNSLNNEYFKHIYRECRNTHFMIKNVFLKIVPFIRYRWNIFWSPRGHSIWRCNTAHALCTPDNWATDAHSESITPFLPRQKWLRERA